MQEKETSTLIASELENMGFEGMRNMGAYNLAGIYKNGEVPTILIHTDIDALRVEEKTRLTCASTVKGIHATRNEMSVTHAFAHKLHMTVLIGTACILIMGKNNCKGIVVKVA